MHDLKFRPCIFGSAANQVGSLYCQLCPEGYMTEKEGAAHCTVPVESTDLHQYYAVILSFSVLLNGTSLEEIESLGTCTQPFFLKKFNWIVLAVHAPGIVVLEILVRTDVADAMNISVGDVAVTNISPVGRHALSIELDTTFKAEISKDAQPEEVDRGLKQTILRGDENVERLVNDPDRAFHRTTSSTNSHAQANFLIILSFESVFG